MDTTVLEEHAAVFYRVDTYTSFYIYLNHNFLIICGRKEIFGMIVAEKKETHFLYNTLF
jgi:hypothetical protein